jgi:hypothetical protein
MMQEALWLLHCGGGTKNAFQPPVHLPTMSAKGVGYGVQKHGCHNHVLAGSEGGKLPLCVLNHRGSPCLQL